jgi:hypothetical protein
MRFPRFAALAALSLMLPVLACSDVETTPTAAFHASSGIDPELVGDRNDDYSVRTGLVNVCAFFGDVNPANPFLGTFSASATGGTVLAGNFTIGPVPPLCMEVWNATDATARAVSSALVSVSSGFVLDRIVTAVGTSSGDAIVTNYTGVTSASVSATDATGAFIWFKLAPRVTPPPGGQGCTPGYWKQSQHFGNWTSPYTPTTSFQSVFGTNPFPGMNLLEVLSQGGGGIKALGRHAVAGLLNAASPSVSYDLTTTQVIEGFNSAYNSGRGGTIERQKNLFDMPNNQSCPLGCAP